MAATRGPSAATTLREGRARERVVPSVPEPPWQPLQRSEVFDLVDATAFAARIHRARRVHQLRVSKRQGLGSDGSLTGSSCDEDGTAHQRLDGDERAVTNGSNASGYASPTAAPSPDQQQPSATTAVAARHADPMVQVPTVVDEPSPAGSSSDQPQPPEGEKRDRRSPPPLPPAGQSAGDDTTDAVRKKEDAGSDVGSGSLARASSGTGTGVSVATAQQIEVPRPSAIQAHFAAGGLLQPQEAQEILRQAMAVLRDEPNVLRLAGPLTVCGDVHGQFHDVLNIFRLGGDPDKTQYLFLGDYVDRGSFSTEIVLTLFARKVLRPHAMWLLRGNHECSYLTSYFNFRQECLQKYDEATYNMFLEAFNCLPLAAIVNGEFLCVHGGLSPFIRTVDDIESINRFRDPPQRGPMCDLLWSDPMEDEEEELCPDALFLHNELRGCSYVYTHAAACDFLQRNGLVAIIRAHEAQEEGYRMYRKVPTSGMPATVCVFSAPNYCEFNNLGAILLIDGRQLQVRQFHSSPQPYALPHFMNAFTWSIPFVFEKLDHVLADMWEVTDAAAFDDNPTAGSGRSGGGGVSLASLIAAQNPRKAPSSSSSGPTAAPAAGGEAGAAAGPSPRDASVKPAMQTTPEERAAALAHLQRAFAGMRAVYMLPRVLRQRGRFIRAKVFAAVRFVLLLRLVRRRKGDAAADSANDDRPAPSA